MGVKSTLFRNNHSLRKFESQSASLIDSVVISPYFILTHSFGTASKQRDYVRVWLELPHDTKFLQEILVICARRIFWKRKKKIFQNIIRIRHSVGVFCLGAITNHVLPKTENQYRGPARCRLDEHRPLYFYAMAVLRSFLMISTSIARRPHQINLTHMENHNIRYRNPLIKTERDHG